MANYSSNLKSWGSNGTEYPTGYSYVDGEQPVDAWDNFFNSNAERDIDHLITLTNKRLESSSGTGYPGTPEDGELCWRSDNQRLAIYGDNFGGWREVAYLADVNDLRSDVNDFEDIYNAHAADESAHHTRYSDDEARVAVDGADVTTAGNVDLQGDVMRGMLAVVSEDYQDHLSIHRGPVQWWIGPTLHLDGGLRMEDGEQMLQIGVEGKIEWNGNEVWHDGNQDPVEETALTMQFLSL